MSIILLLLQAFLGSKIVYGTRQQLRNNLNGEVLRVVTGHVRVLKKCYVISFTINNNSIAKCAGEKICLI